MEETSRQINRYGGPFQTTTNLQCSDLLQCYYRLLARPEWVRCSRLLEGLYKVQVKKEKQKQKENSQETWQSQIAMLHFRKRFLEKPQIKNLRCLPVLLAGSLLLSACSTLRPSPYSVPSTPMLTSSPLFHPNSSKNSTSFGDSSKCHLTLESQPQSQQGTSPSSRLPLWELSSGSISHPVEKDKHRAIWE